MPSAKSSLEKILIDSLLKAGRLKTCHRVILIGSSEIEKLKPIRKKLIYATTLPASAHKLEAAGYDVVVLPGFAASRNDRLKTAILGAMSHGFVQPGNTICAGLTGQEGAAIDSVLEVAAKKQHMEYSPFELTRFSEDVSPKLLETAVHLALRIGREGYEGRTLGFLMVIGDSTAVMESSHQLTINPFQGYSEAERNLFDPSVREAVRTFATLDGAFIIRDDGVVLSAGRHIQVSSAPHIPLGLGARHTAAAFISESTNALAVAVSQSTGTMRVFKKGEIVLEIQPESRRVDGESTLPAPVKKTRKRSKLSTKRSSKTTKKSSAK